MPWGKKYTKTHVHMYIYKHTYNINIYLYISIRKFWKIMETFSKAEPGSKFQI